MHSTNSMKKAILLIMKLNLAALFLTGCGQSADPLAPVKKLYKPSPDTDVTASPEFNFASFSGSVWKTKVETAVADLKRYTGAPQTNLLPPDGFDSKHPRYNPPSNMKLVAILPVGTRVRITRLMKDNGAWGGVRVTANVEAGTNAPVTVFLDKIFLADNIHVNRGPTTSTNWGVNPDLLEEAK